MTTTDNDIHAALDQLDRALTPAPVLVRDRVTQFRLDREKGEKPLPVATARDIHGAPLLDVKQVEVSARPNYAPNVWERRRRSLLQRLLRRR